MAAFDHIALYMGGLLPLNYQRGCQLSWHLASQSRDYFCEVASICMWSAQPNMAREDQPC
ncbi:hypothetical protein CY34DRAFT_389885 [Suillus luteus UH-Slu-Lm8-n1]|uniref:Uncharacterized protein n=1 Tax=Suillus luteus UH-Slu-Lm8-n1 TaxID=930992 RepID=A0A0D0A8V5_9AGAM|nr:hypothetical protein CY34DRAFT_389885 [Suillus luteus UH-Slu-Lm8-n1]